MLSNQEILNLKYDYENEPLTVLDLSEKYKICEDTIRKKAKKFNWIRSAQILSQIELKRRKNISKTLNNKTDIQKQETIQKRKNTSKQRYGTELYFNTDKWKQTYWGKSAKERRDITKKAIDTRKSMSLDRKNLRNERWKTTMSLKTSEERKNIYIKAIETKRKKYNGDIISIEKRELLSNRWKSYTPDEKKEKLNKLQYKWLNDPVERQKIIQKIRQNWEKKSEAEKSNINRKRNITWQKKSAKELQLINEKRRATLLSNYSKEELSSLRKEGMKTKYDREHYKQAHISVEALKILKSPELLEKFINDIDIEHRTRIYIAEKLNINVSHLNHIIQKYGLYDINWGYSKSKYEEEIYEYLTDIYKGKIERNNRKAIAPLELDFYLPDMKLAIEFNGSYFHSTHSFRKLPNNYHQTKSKLCEEKGIRLIHIFEYEWEDNNKKSKLKSIINIALNNCQNKIFARKCKLHIETNTLKLKQFINENHIQGYRGGKFAIYLTYEADIVMCMIFGYPYLSRNKYDIEVIRACTKLNTIVVGGFSKIWNYFINNYNYNTCVYYVNYNYYSGKSLNNVDGFCETNKSIGYVNLDVKTGMILNRNPSANKLYKKYQKEGNLIKIYNAGTKTYVWQRRS